MIAPMPADHRRISAAISIIIIVLFIIKFYEAQRFSNYVFPRQDSRLGGSQPAPLDRELSRSCGCPQGDWHATKAQEGPYCKASANHHGISRRPVILWASAQKKQLQTECPIQFTTDCSVQYATDCSVQFTTEYPVQFTTEYPNQLTSDYPIQLSCDCSIFKQRPTTSNNDHRQIKMQ